jgi:ankyrin repeat protein
MGKTEDAKLLAAVQGRDAAAARAALDEGANVECFNVVRSAATLRRAAAAARARAAGGRAPARGLAFVPDCLTLAAALTSALRCAHLRAQDDATALTYAALTGDVAVVALLLERGAKTTVKHMARGSSAKRSGAGAPRFMPRAPRVGRRPRAACCAPPLGLLSAGALTATEPHADCRAQDGWTPLHYAAAHGHASAAAALVEHGADKAAKDDVRGAAAKRMQPV